MRSVRCGALAVAWGHIVLAVPQAPASGAPCCITQPRPTPTPHMRVAGGGAVLMQSGQAVFMLAHHAGKHTSCIVMARGRGKHHRRMLCVLLCYDAACKLKPLPPACAAWAGGTFMQHCLFLVAQASMRRAAIRRGNSSGFGHIACRRVCLGLDFGHDARISAPALADHQPHQREPSARDLQRLDGVA